jgi:acyl-CoA thioesterase
MTYLRADGSARGGPQGWRGDARPEGCAVAEEVVNTNPTSPFKTWLAVSHPECAGGQVECRLTVRNEMRNGRGQVHGGVLASLFDVTMSAAANQDVAQPVTTVDLHVSYCVPAYGPQVECRARVVAAGSSVIRCYAEATSMDRLVAVAVGTWARASRESGREHAL